MPSDVVAQLARDLSRFYWRLRYLSKRALYAMSLLLYAAVIGHWVAPKVFTDFHADSRITGSAAVEQAVRELKLTAQSHAAAGRNTSETFAAPVTVQINPMLEVHVTATVNESSPTYYRLQTDAQIRVDSLILYTGIWLVATLAIALANRGPGLMKRRRDDPSALTAAIAQSTGGYSTDRHACFRRGHRLDFAPAVSCVN
jgi:hypothetical protein